MVGRIIEELPELYLQKLIRIALSDTTRHWYTVDGRPCQFLSPGEWNFESGPDFLNVAALIEGHLLIGHGEVHRYRSEWQAHRHSQHRQHQHTVFHFFVINDRTPPEEPPFAFHLSPSLLEPIFERDQQALEQTACDINALEILQEYAYRRIVRKAEAMTLLLQQYNGVLSEAVFHATVDFFNRQRGKTRRPRGLRRYQSAFHSPTVLEPWIHLLHSIAAHTPIDLFATLNTLAQTPLTREGKGSRLELMINVLLPFAFALSDAAEERADLLMWFWSQKAPHRYGKLARRFPHLPQEYVWQQQGMLEYLRECQRGQQRCAELLLPYFTATDPQTFQGLPTQWIE